MCWRLTDPASVLRRSRYRCRLLIGTTPSSPAPCRRNKRRRVIRPCCCHADTSLPENRWSGWREARRECSTREFDKIGSLVPTADFCQSSDLLPFSLWTHTFRCSARLFDSQAGRSNVPTAPSSVTWPLRSKYISERELASWWDVD